LINQFKPQEVVGDVFAGVGPFAVPAGKKNVLVLANDLNPESYKYLQENVKLNHVENFVKPFNLDGREFIRQSPRLLFDWIKQSSTIETKKLVKRRKLDKTTKSERSARDYDITKIVIPKYYSNYVMNLPDSALTFLDEFIGLYSDPEIEAFVKSDKDFKLPTINVHCFEKYSPQEQPEPSQKEIESRVHQKIVKLLDYPLPLEACKFHLVRRVAPTKPMFCVSFQLPEEVAFRKRD
jgi:tRNA (guanine37-N1)-methyltransferase